MAIPSARQQADEMVYPPDFTYPERKAKMAQLIARILSHLVSRRRAVVQAGGCSGLWPIALSTVFDQVYTFEPDPANAQCLMENTAAYPNISAYGFALGATSARVGLTRPKARAGLWRVDGDGEIPQLTIDDVIGDRPVDAIVLDVEGSEVAALQGAARVIARHRPLLWFECVEHVGDIRAFLEAHGYVPPRPGLHVDCYSVHASQVRYA